MAGARIVVNAAGRLKRLRDALCHGKRAGADSTVIEVSVQIEAQQRLEERPERGLARSKDRSEATPKHSEAPFKFCDGAWGRANGGAGGSAWRVADLQFRESGRGVELS